MYSTPLIDAFKWLSFSQISNWLGLLDELDFTHDEYDQIFRFARQKTHDIAVLEYLLDRANREKKLYFLQSIVANLEVVQDSQLPTVDMLEALMPEFLLTDQEIGHLFILNCTSTRMHMIHEMIIQNTEFNPINCSVRKE